MSINKQKLLDMLGSPKDISDKDLEELEDAVRQYPYFQLGYSLISKAKYDRQTPDAYDSLSLAAIYAPDRTILKKIFYDNLRITSQPAEGADIQTVAHAPAEGVSLTPESLKTEEKESDATTAEVVTEGDAITTEVTTESDTTTAEVSEESDAVTTEVTTESDDTAKQIATENETTLEDTGSGEKENNAIAEEPVPADTPKTSNEIKITDVLPEEQKISIEKNEADEAVYRELEENLKNLRKHKIKFDDEADDTEGSDKKKTLIESVPPENEVLKPDTTSSDLQKKTSTENVKSTREKGTSRLLTEISALSPLPAEQVRVKQQTQFSLIDKFINTQPEIVYKDQGTRDIQLSDLSEKSTLTRDHLLTENFAAIMLKQGRVDKAIEIYRKLIWKFPQKKAYFASKVKALKESE